MKDKKGILLVNLGTPDSPKTSDVRKYLREFLSDPRVLDINGVLRYILVNGVIAPFRSPNSAKSYKEIWTENGSPLLHYSKLQQQKLQAKLGSNYVVELAMRYQSPSIEAALNRFKEQKIFDIKVIPMFPQYASASTGSVIEKVMDVVGKWQITPNIEIINSFHDQPKMIEAFADLGKKHNHAEYDYVLFSFHGLPVRQLVKADPSSCHCQNVENCCQKFNVNNRYCYSAQSHQTAYLIADALQIPKEKYTICFQSRLGRDPWVQPYTTDVFKKLAAEGKKKILIFCPAFTADCLETIFEISEEYNEEFIELGGEKMQLVEGLNDHPIFIDALADLSVN